MIDTATIIRLAREAGGTPYQNRHYPGETAMAFGPQALQDFAQAIYRQGLEDAARYVEEPYEFTTADASRLAQEIRALKEEA